MSVISNVDIYKKQLDDVLMEFNGLSMNSDPNDISRAVTRAITVVNRIAGPNSDYSSEIERQINLIAEPAYYYSNVLGILEALRDDVSAGYLGSVEELIHGDLFSDFLEMADHLNDSGLKDPAAVVAGAALESHLRKLAQKFAISIEKDGKYHKADRINADLKNGDVYNALDHKNVIAWLDLRNKAAHGKYDEYGKEQVALFISSIRDFITRYPA